MHDLRLTVLSIGFPFSPIKPDTAGGAEHVLAMIDERLVLDGHESIVIAPPMSKIAGLLLEGPEIDQNLNEQLKHGVYSRLREVISTALEQYDVDVIHMHGLDFFRYLPDTSLPILVTLHLPISWYPKKAFMRNGKRLYFNCVSASQHKSCPEINGLLPFISNGVPVRRLSGFGAKKSYALSLGRICPEKGFHLAIDAAKAAGIPFILAGEVHPYREHQEYFETEILPRLDGIQYKHIGPVDFAFKKPLLIGAKCVIIPSLIPETSSLVAMEAAAVGTPVIAFATGALPEVVEHGKTGFLVNDQTEIVRAISDLNRIDPGYCRKIAAIRFNGDRMVRDYIAAYSDIMGPLTLGNVAEAGRFSTSVPEPEVPTSFHKVNKTAKGDENLRIRIISHTNGLMEIRNSWERLYELAENKTPFLSPAWQITWWRFFQPGQLFTIAFYKDQLVGLAPLYIEKGRIKFIGTGISDYLDILALENYKEEVVGALMKVLESNDSPWDICDFTDLDKDSSLLKSGIRTTMTACLEAWDTCSVIQLPDQPEYYFASLEGKYRRRFYKAKRMLEHSGKLELVKANEDTFVDLMTALVRLHQRSWNVRDQSGVLSGNKIRSFHVEAAFNLLRKGELGLYALKHNDGIISVIYGMQSKERFYSYLGGFEPAMAKYSPGRIILLMVIERLITEGIREFDFLRGTENYKYSWGAVDKKTFRLKLSRKAMSLNCRSADGHLMN